MPGVEEQQADNSFASHERKLVLPATVIDQLLSRIRQFRSRGQSKSKAPFKLLLSGLQGSGKTTWASAMADTLRQEQGYKVVVVSLDDFYQTHENLVKIREENPENAMLKTRGQPGTHDEKLAQDFFSSLETATEIKVPIFDKSLYDGEGDRLAESAWHVVSNDPFVDVLIFEGWCIGFKALEQAQLRQFWLQRLTSGSSSEDSSDRCSTTVLKSHAFEHVLVINEHLKHYNETFMRPDDFQYLIHLDTTSLTNVYRWRIDQEHALRASRGSGMTNEAVVEFVRGYMPAYELYLEKLQQEPFIPHAPGASTQMKVLLDACRQVVDTVEL